MLTRCAGGSDSAADGALSRRDERRVAAEQRAQRAAQKKPLQKRLGDALQKVVTSEEFKKLMDSRKFGIEFANPTDFAAYLVTADARFGAAAKAAGLAK